MGKLICTKCKATSEASTFEKADEQIDHAIGTLRGKPCNANPLDLLWNGKPVATVVFHYGPGSKDHAAEKGKADVEAEKKAIAAKKKAEQEAKNKDKNSPEDDEDSSTKE